MVYEEVKVGEYQDRFWLRLQVFTDIALITPGCIIYLKLCESRAIMEKVVTVIFSSIQ